MPVLMDTQRAPRVYCTPQEAADMLDLSLRTVKRMAAAGELALYQIGSRRAYRFKTADVQALITRVN